MSKIQRGVNSAETLTMWVVWYPLLLSGGGILESNMVLVLIVKHGCRPISPSASTARGMQGQSAEDASSQGGAEGRRSRRRNLVCVLMFPKCQ